LRSTVHRVTFPGGGAAAVDGESGTDPRYSIAFFCHPFDDCHLTAVPSERVVAYSAPKDAGKGNPYAERKVVTAAEHLQMRLRASYLGLYDEDEREGK
jgi:isopenicillin N synthase-like dioxygenase